MTIDLVGSPTGPLRLSTLSRIVAAIANGLRTADEQLSRHAQQRSGRALLMEMPDHMLRDIGISRSAIDHAVRYGRNIDSPLNVVRSGARAEPEGILKIVERKDDG